MPRNAAVPWPAPVSAVAPADPTAGLKHPDTAKILAKLNESKGDGAGAAPTKSAQNTNNKRLVSLAREAGYEVVRDRGTGQRFGIVPGSASAPRRRVLNYDGTRAWLAELAGERGLVPSGGALADATGALQADANARVVSTDLRVASSADGARLLYDLGDDSGVAASVGAGGWHLEPAPEALFVLSTKMHPQVQPVPGGDLTELGPLLGLRGEPLALYVSWLLGALHPEGPFPILCLAGPAGAGKSLITRFTISLLDPQRSPLNPVPKDERELAISAEHNRILAFDNLSRLHPDMADALCRLATGGGITHRENYSDRKLAVFDSKRPVILNGIPSLLDRSDLGDRAILIEMPARRSFRTERELTADFEAARPRLLGALLTAASGALAHRGDAFRAGANVRMADFAGWVLAATSAGAVPFTGEEFLAAYTENRRAIATASVDADPIAPFLFVRVEHVGSFVEESASDLLASLTARAAVDALPPRARADWPTTATALGMRLSRLTSSAALRGVEISQVRRGSRRFWRIERVAAEAEDTP